MKLVNRVSVFFLAALAVVLAIYSGLFYAFVRARLVQQFEQELHAALNSLVAAVEVEPEEVKWQPLEHTIALGAAEGPGEVQWAVIGDGSMLVERSRGASPELVERARAIAASAAQGSAAETPKSDDWHIRHRRLSAPAPDRSQRELDEFDEITVVVARSDTSLRANLNRLLLLVCTLPVAGWLVAAALGHWLCRRALQPVLDMAKQARSMTGADLHSRLPVAEAGDELADLAMAFNTLLDRQHRAFEQQRRFAGDAAHELRTPLTVLLGQLDVCLRRSRSPEEYESTLGVLRDQTAELHKTVESLLFLARSDDDAALPDAETIALDAWLAGYLDHWKLHERRADIHLSIGQNGAYRVNASAALLARLLDNLIENALKYSEPGSRVDVALDKGSSGICVSVADQGCGIAAEDQKTIFEPFFRSQAARSAGIAGTGLGLAIAARIARALGGRLECASELGRGSRFTFWLAPPDVPPEGSSRGT